CFGWTGRRQKKAKRSKAASSRRTPKQPKIQNGAAHRTPKRLPLVFIPGVSLMDKIMIFIAGVITGCLLTFVLMGSLLLFRVQVEREATVRAYEEAMMEREQAEQARREAEMQRDLAEQKRQEAEALRQRDKE